MNWLSQPKENFTQWLTLFTATLLGMLFASALVAQEPFSIVTAQPLEALSINRIETNSSDKSPGETEVNLNTFTIAPATAPQQDCCHEPSAVDQFVLTKDRSPRRTCVRVSSQDQVWLVDAREAHCSPGDVSRLQCSVLQAGQWSTRNIGDLTSLHATDKSCVTFVYVHGNRTDKSWAISRGLQFYQSLFEQNRSTGRPPIRFVIFAWKSEQEKIRLRPDYNIKSKRSPVVGLTFGAFLRQFTDRDIVVCGFSLGSQVVLAGLSESEKWARDALASKFKVALLAPALDPGYVCSQLTRLTSNRLIESTEVFYSQSDRAIRAAEKIARKSCRAWIPIFQQLARSYNSINPVSITDLTNQVKKQHATETYISSPVVQQSLSRMVCEMAVRDQFVSESFETPFEATPSLPENSHQILIPALPASEE